MDTSFFKRWSTRLAVVLPIFFVCVALPVEAAQTRDKTKNLGSPATSNSFAPTPGISLEKATRIAREHTGGRVLSSTFRQRASGSEYRVRMLVDGERVITVTVDHKGRIKNKR